MEITEHIKSGMLWNAIGFILRFIIGLGSSIIFVRLLGQHNYGTVTFILTWFFFSTMIANLGLGTVITKCVAEQRARNTRSYLVSMLKKVTMIRLVVIAILGIGFYFSPQLASWVGKPHIGRFLYYVPLMVITAYYYTTFNTLLTAYYEQKFINLTSILELLVKLGFVVIAVYYGYIIVGFIAAIILSQIFAGTMLAWRAYKQIFKKLTRTSLPFNFRSNIPLAYNSFLILMSRRLLGRESDIFLLGTLHHDIREVAVYAVIFGLPAMTFGIFNNIIGGGLGLTAFTELAKSAQIDKLRRNYSQILHFFFMFLFPTIIGGSLVGGDLAEIMYGHEYQGLNLPLAILFFAIGIGSINSITRNILYALDHDRNLRRCRFGFGLLNIIVNIIIIPKYGALGVAITTGAASICITITEVLLIHFTIRPNYPVKNCLRYLIIASIMGGVVYIAPFAFYWKILVGICVYGLLFWIHEMKFNNGKNLRLFLKIRK
jgi:O-antigen/teichoic acid export membrane protein